MIFGHEGEVDVVNVLCTLTVLQRETQDHDGASVYYEVDLPPEGTVETVGEVIEDPGEELSGEGMSPKTKLERRERRKMMTQRGLTVRWAISMEYWVECGPGPASTHTPNPCDPLLRVRVRISMRRLKA